MQIVYHLIIPTTKSNVLVTISHLRNTFEGVRNPLTSIIEIESDFYADIPNQH